MSFDKNGPIKLSLLREVRTIACGCGLEELMSHNAARERTGEK